MQDHIKEHWEVIVIGGGQAGLSAGHYLRSKGVDFLILDSSKEVGDSWKNRWDSLVLFTPRRFDGLPGYPFPGDANTFPNKNEMASYLKDYSRKFSLPILPNTSVERITKGPKGFSLETKSKMFSCSNVIVATGHSFPKIPDFSINIKFDIKQIHSSQYKNPSELSDGDVLIVGAGTSGVQLAMEISHTHKTFISGKIPGKIPDLLFRFSGFYWWFISNILTIRTPIGRKIRRQVLTSGAPLIKESEKDLNVSGAIRVPRIVGAKDGLPLLQDGKTLQVSTIVWCTGFKPDFSWIQVPYLRLDDLGWPVAPRGISNVKGLYFLGNLFQFGLTSSLVGGAGRDAMHVVEELLLDREE
ncbi:potassium transporter Trk [Leptospira langatensis]|uniref:Potassium transporter Trk n=1 Tax=Leptospira langatensis TaxID=2484983 RepID=A0A5F1ZS83_9LEPT|nr:NAD(P)-binding domain-containing protein [Leptospira langatensis]TGJ98941.1 potassium transporter Trk [Leptospira langatensis]TGL40490.1 potassium transporter Trk [Leptospira langatensis]